MSGDMIDHWRLLSLNLQSLVTSRWLGDRVSSAGVDSEPRYQLRYWPLTGNRSSCACAVRSELLSCRRPILVHFHRPARSTEARIWDWILTKDGGWDENERNWTSVWRKTRHEDREKTDQNGLMSTDLSANGPCSDVAYWTIVSPMSLVERTDSWVEANVRNKRRAIRRLGLLSLY